MRGLLILLATIGAVWVLGAVVPSWSPNGPLRAWLQFTPAALTIAPADPQTWVSLIASLVVHADHWPLAANAMGFILITPAVMERTGTLPGLVLALLCGVAGNLAHWLAEPLGLPTWGASGMVAGLMGAALMLNRLAPIPTIVFPMSLAPPVVLGALLWFQLVRGGFRLRHLIWWLVPVWIPVLLWPLGCLAGLQLLLLAGQPRGPVLLDPTTYVAPLGGFAAGIVLSVLGRPFLRPRATTLGLAAGYVQDRSVQRAVLQDLKEDDQRRDARTSTVLRP